MPLSEVTDCLRDWLFEMIDYALERQPSVSLAHARFEAQLEHTRTQVTHSISIGTQLESHSRRVRENANTWKLEARRKMQIGDAESARHCIKHFFKELELASFVEQECQRTHKRNRRLLMVLIHMEAMERRLYFLSLFLAPLPAFAASEYDDHFLMLQSMWEFISGEPLNDTALRTSRLVEKFEKLEFNALNEYAHIDRKHATRLRSSERHKLEKRIKTQIPLLQEELKKQNARLAELDKEEKRLLREGSRFQHGLTIVRQKHCQKLLLRLEVYQMILAKTEMELSSPLQNKGQEASAST